MKIYTLYFGKNKNSNHLFKIKQDEKKSRI